MEQLDPLCATALALQPPCHETENGFSLRSVLSSHSLAAVNTFIDGAPTWTDAFGHSRRIDFIAVPAALVPMVKECYVDHNINLSPMVRADHELLRVSIPLSVFSCAQEKVEPKSCLPTTRSSPPAPPQWVLEDPVNVSRFQWLLQDFVFDPKGSIDHEVARWTKTVQTAQRQAFPVPRFRPRKPWISFQSWPASRRTAACRSLMRRWKQRSRLFSTNVWFTLWRLSTHHRSGVEIDMLLAPALNLYHYAHFYAALCDRSMRSLTVLKNKILRCDRQLSLKQFAHRAAKAAARSDFRTTFKIVKSPAGSSPKPLQSVSAKDGSLLTQAEHIKQRWRQHHAEVLSAVIVSSPYDSCPVPDLSQSGATCDTQDWSPFLADVANFLMSVDGSKALGPDGTSACVLRVGGRVLLEQLHDIISASISQCRFPVPWLGGRLVNHHMKGDPKDCNNWRGLHVGDHAGKILSSVLAQQVLPSYVKFVGPCQFGATPKMVLHLHLTPSGLLSMSHECWVTPQLSCT